MAVDSPKVERPSWGLNGDHPAIEVDWYGAAAYTNWLSERQGLRPAYTFDSLRVSWDSTANGYRLPTEAEWEFAAGGGNIDRDSLGYKKSVFAGLEDLDSLAWYSSNSKSQTHPVGTKNANGLGTFDMSGNVWEWCWDRYSKEYYQSLVDQYEKGPAPDPKGPKVGTRRVVRGGSWYNDFYYCRVSVRN